jgi:hypothetical protein
MIHASRGHRLAVLGNFYTHLVGLEMIWHRNRIVTQDLTGGRSDATLE